MSKRRTLYLLDANSLLHRAWHALPPLTNPEGQLVQAVYGVMNTVLKLVHEKKPDAFAAAWDTEVPTFRHEAYQAYKATREEKPDELYEQIPLVKEGLSYLGIPSLELDGYEADDVIGTVAKKYAKNGWDVVIVTGDRDMLQLIETHLHVLAFKRGVSDTVLYDAKEVKAEYGLTVEQFLEYKAMRGDPSDNIPGISGIGDKTATALLQTYKSLRGIFRAAHNDSSDLKPGVRAKLLQAEPEMDDILNLVRIRLDAPIDYRPEPGSVHIKDPVGLEAFLRRMNFNTLLKRLNLKDDRKKKALKNVSHKEAADEASALRAVDELEQESRIVIFPSGGGENTLFGDAPEVLGVAGKNMTFLFKGEGLSSKRVIAKLQKAFEKRSPIRVSHDAKTVMERLDKLGLLVRSWDFDTMLAAYLLTAGERSHDLPSVADRYANIHLRAESGLSDQLHAIRTSYETLKKELKDEKLDTILERFELPLVPILYDMEKRGIKIDAPYLQTLSKKLSKERDRLEKKMIQAAGREFNPASPIQLAEILFVDLKLPTKGIKKGKTGYSTAASELEKLRGKHKIIEQVEAYREISKLLSTYVDVLPGLADKCGRIHTTFQQAVTATGRLSSTNPNLQNIPIRTELGREIRRAFVAEKGFVLLGCDYSQIELRVAAALSGDRAMAKAFLEGKDIHTETAAVIWGVDSSKVTKDQRRAAKAINFGVLYGQGPVGLAQTAGISFSEAKEFIRAYFEAYPALKRYLDKTKAFARREGFAETLFGRRRPIPEIESNLPQVRAHGERMAINMPVQGTAADIIKLAMIEVRKGLGSVSKEARMILQVHDELLFEVPPAELDQVSKFVKKTMEHVHDIGVPLLVEPNMGSNWQEMRPL